MTPKLVSLVGRSNSGKTTLITRLIALFSQLGLNVGTIKNTHHQVEFDHPGKDSWKHQQAGSSQVLLISNSKLALYSDVNPEQSLSETVERWFPDFDIVISEGFKNEDCLKIEVFRQANRKTPLYLDPAYDIQAIVCDTPPDVPLPHFHPDDIRGIHEWICDKLQLPLKNAPQ